MIASYQREKEKSGIELFSDKPCVVLAGDMWQERLNNIKDSLVFIDEDDKFVVNKEFAKMAKNSDNYYIIISRDNLTSLPYSVDEIYELKNKTRGYGNIKRLYTSIEKIYSENFDNLDKPDCVIVEDSKAGFTLWKKICHENNIECVSAKGYSNVGKAILKRREDEKILIVADGAAFGPMMENIMLLRYKYAINIYLPESFEWLILSSDLLKDKEVCDILDEPSDYIDSKKFFTWERFFTSVLVDKTKGTYLRYDKNELNEAYLQKKNLDMIRDVMPKMGMR